MSIFTTYLDAYVLKVSLLAKGDPDVAIVTTAFSGRLSSRENAPMGIRGDIKRAQRILTLLEPEL